MDDLGRYISVNIDENGNVLRDKRMIEELKEHCDELELINQKVMEENEQLKQKLVGKENEFKYFSNSYQSKIKELQKQIERMKNCENCKIEDTNKCLLCSRLDCLTNRQDFWELAE